MRKVNTLLQTLYPRHPGEYPNSPGWQGPIPEFQPHQSPPGISTPHPLSNHSIPQGINAEPSWSWPVFIDVDGWESYCDEISGVFS